MLMRYRKSASWSIALAVVVALSYGVWQDDRILPANAATHPASEITDTLRYPAGAPQLAYIRTKAVEAYPEPLMGELNARIAYDDNRTSRVYSPIAGRVQEIRAEAGQRVRKGDPLLLIDSPDYAAAASDLLKAEADGKNKRIAYERAKLLYESRGMALKDLEQAEADWRQAEAEAERSRARMNNLGSDKVVAADGKFILRAPTAGVVSERQVNAGSEVRPDAANPLFVITDPAHVWVMADLPEQQIGKIRVGLPVSVEVDAYPGEVFSGKIAVIGETLDPVTRRFQVRCSVANEQNKLRPEMYARISPVVAEDSKLPRVPNTALFTQGLYSFVFVEQSPGVFQRRRVTLGLQDASFSYVREGLHAGERIVVAGSLLLNSELAGSD